jgi:hypothetical protein
LNDPELKTVFKAALENGAEVITRQNDDVISAVSILVAGAVMVTLRGAAIASVALLLFAPLFATFYILTSPPTEHWNLLGLTLMVLAGSAVAM